MSLDFLNEALEAEEVSLMRSLNEPAGGAEPGAKQPGESSGSESSFDKMLNDREVVLAAASAAGLQKTGGLKRVAFSMNDLTALNPRGPAAAAAGVGKPAKPSKKKPPNMPSVPEGRQPPAPAEIKLEHPFANVNVGVISLQNVTLGGPVHGLFVEFERRVRLALWTRGWWADGHLLRDPWCMYVRAAASAASRSSSSVGRSGGGGGCCGCGGC